MSIQCDLFGKKEKKWAIVVVIKFPFKTKMVAKVSTKNSKFQCNLQVNLQFHSLGSGNGDNGLLNVMRNDTQFSGGGSSRLSSQDIIRHPPHSRPSVRLESANGNKKNVSSISKDLLQIKKFVFRFKEL